MEAGPQPFELAPFQGVSTTSPFVYPQVPLWFPVLAVAVAVFCVWLTVRIINRRERWAKWMLAALVGLPVLYVLSVGPALWLSDRFYPRVLSEKQTYNLIAAVDSTYAPLQWLSERSLRFNEFYAWYISIWGYVRFSDTEAYGFPVPNSR